MVRTLRSEIATSFIELSGHGAESIEVYVATVAHPSPRGGVVVIHHLPGFDEGIREIVRKFAVMGYNAACVNLYYREAPGASSDDAAAIARAQGGVPDERLVGDVAAALAYLRDLDNSNGRVGVIGYCSGGRQTVLAACHLDFDAAVDCYGAFVVVGTPEGSPFNFPALTPILADLHCPMLGLFGADDQYPSPEQTSELEALLAHAGKNFTAHTYEGAGHAFFAVDRPSYRPEVAKEAWSEVADFFDIHLSV